MGNWEFRCKFCGFVLIEALVFHSDNPSDPLRGSPPFAQGRLWVRRQTCGPVIDASNDREIVDLRSHFNSTLHSPHSTLSSAAAAFYNSQFIFHFHNILKYS